MKGKRSVILSGSIYLVSILAGLMFMGVRGVQSTEPPLKPIKLRCLAYEPTSRCKNLTETWIGEVERRTGGRVNITPLYGALPFQQLYDAVIAGTADISFMWVQSNTGRWPALEVMQLCEFDTVCHRPARVAWELYKAFPEIQKGFAQTKILALMATSPTPPGIGIATVKGKAVRTLEDMKGLKVQGAGGWYSSKISALGASPMGVFPSQFYESLQRKVLDGVTPDPEHFKTRKIGEVVSYFTRVNMGFMPWWFAMNLDTWNRLPPDIQRIFEETGGEWYVDKIFDSAFRASVAEILPWIAKEYGIEIIELPPEEVARWNERLKPVLGKYAAELEAKGLPAKRLIEEARRLYVKYRE